MSSNMTLRNISSLVGILLIAVAVHTTASQEVPIDDDAPTYQRVNKVLDELIELKRLPKEASVTQLFQVIEEQILKKHGITISIDKDALGAEFSDLAATPLKMPRLRSMLLGAILRWVQLRLSHDGELDYRVRPNEIILTTSERAAYAKIYQIGDLLKDKAWHTIERTWQDQSSPGYLPPGTIKDKGQRALILSKSLAAALTAHHSSYRRVQLINGSQVIVHASRSQHREIASRMFDSLRGAADIAVVMNAKLFEVDRAFYEKEIQPALSAARQKQNLLTPITLKLAERMQKQKLIIEGTKGSLGVCQEIPFLSLQNVAAYSRPSEGSSATLFEWHGVVLSVHIDVSADRRRLRLKISEKAKQLLDVKKFRQVDPKQQLSVLEMEVPSFKETATSATIAIDDGQPLLMKLQYRPSQPSDAVWMVLMQPIIYIEEEQELIRKQIIPDPLKNEGIKPEPVKPAIRLPQTKDVKEILRVVVTDILTNPKLKSSRDFYGTPGDKGIAMIDGEFAWTKKVPPTGFQLRRPYDGFGSQSRLLGLTLEGFDLKKDPAEAHVQVDFYNAGGTANGPGNGYCRISYSDGKRMEVGWRFSQKSLIHEPNSFDGLHGFVQTKAWFNPG